ncbi:hypothetical protein [Lutibacter oricola]|nr:hypothetical protein [Lutibacter oricola]
MKDINFFKGKSAHYQSKSGSLYLYTKQGVYRYSNHWGRVANCRWKISGIEKYRSQDYYVGYANWSDFFPLNNAEKSFYLDVDYSVGKTKIIRSREENNTAHFLMTSDFAHQRLKQINALFKDYKWAKYFDEDIDELRVRLIDNLISSNTSIQELKRNL